jgi:glycosyltransferase involved in cell wall biosynthesis
MAETDRRLRFSVVVPARNEADNLGTTLQSLAAQGFRGGYEVIVVDNGSSDRTAAIARGAGVRVATEPVPGVCAARQRGVELARGEIIVSTDADTVHPPGWLSRIDRTFRDAEAQGRPAIAVAGPCRYADPPWWAAVLPPLWFAAIGALHRSTGMIGYLTATNVAFVRDRFPGYDVRLYNGGDEVDLLRRLKARGRVLWDGGNVVTTSSRRMAQGLAHTVLISFGYYYLLPAVLNALTGRPVIGSPPAIRDHDRPRVRRQRRAWQLIMGAAVITAVVVRRSTKHGKR